MMRVFFDPTTKNTFELTDRRLRMYQRLLRLNSENSEGLAYVLRVLFQIEQKFAVEHSNLVAQLKEVHFIKEDTSSHCKIWGKKTVINSDEMAFINFIMNPTHAWVGMMKDETKLTSINLLIIIQMGMMETDKTVSRLQDIEQEVKPDTSCSIM